MVASVVVVAGPAGSGKTDWLLDRYRRALADGSVDRTLWIAPTHRSAADVLNRLLAGDLLACFSPGVMTFEGFAERVLNASGGENRGLGDTLKRQLIVRLIDQARAAGQIEYFAPLVDSAGFVDLVAGFISELKRLEIWPEHFEAACRKRGLTTKDAELIALYARYQDALTAHQFYDREGRFWSARRLLRDGQHRPFEQLRLVAVDGFTDFTRTQHEILEILAQRVEQVLISLPLESSSERSDLFAKTQVTLAELERRHTNLQVEWQTRPAQPAWPTMAHLESELFKNPHDMQSIDHVEGVELIAAASQMGEIEQVAGRIKQLIAVQGVSPGEIAVVFRSLHNAAPLVREVFDEYGIPVAIEAPPTLDSVPGMKALLAVLRVHVEDWPFRQLLALLANNFFRPDWPEWHGDRAVEAAERLVRELQIPSGRNTLLSRLDYWASDELPDELAQNMDADWLNSRRNRARLALPLLRRLAEALDQFPKAANQTQWAAAWSHVARDLGWWKVAQSPCAPAHTDREHEAFERFQKALITGDQMCLGLGEEPSLVEPAEMLELATQLLARETLPHREEELGRVRVLAAPSVRALNVGYLFLAGLAEQSFPQAEQENRLYGEAENRQLIQVDLPLVDRTVRSQEEMLLFYEVLTRATRRLTLSYPALDAAAQPLSPSSYLLEVQRAFGEGKLLASGPPDLSPVPRGPELFGPTDLRVRAVADAVEGDPKLLAGLMNHPSAANVSDMLRAALTTAHQRHRGQSFGPFEGVLSGKEAQQRLAEAYGSSHPWSASELEQYAYCPHQFFLSRVLKVEPLEELSLSIDYMTRGHLLHETLSHVHRRLNEQSAGQEVLNDEAAFVELFDRVLAECLEAELGGSAWDTAQREIDRRILAKWGRLYFEQQRKYRDLWSSLDEPLRPEHFEVRFGPARRAASDHEDPLSTDTPFELVIDGETLQFTGRIDRIDVGRVAGRTVFNIIDYKSGRAKPLKPKDIESGVSLQLPLYTIAAQNVLLADRNAMAWRMAYWFVREKGYSEGKSGKLAQSDDGALFADDGWVQMQETMAKRVGQIVRGIREGAFPMFSTDDNCTGNCPFSTVCRVNHTRALDKLWPPVTAGEIS